MNDDLWQPIQFDRELIKKYDRPGPRYTSYPTAPQFTADFGSAQYSDLLASSVVSSRPLSLYVHIPFCAHRCFFCGCNVTISKDRSWGKRYLPLLEQEMAMASERLDGTHRETVQIHWGGGTPTFLPPEDLTELMAAIRRHFNVAPGCEIGVEIDPRECSEAHLDALTAGGVNRLSMGLQELDPKVQRAVNRMQTLEQTRAIIEGGRRRGVESVNVDLIYGLPYQTPEGFAATLREVIALAPDRLALFNFAYLPQMFPHQKTIRPETLPDPESKLRMLEEAIAALTSGAGGYVFIGMDHFARPHAHPQLPGLLHLRRDRSRRLRRLLDQRGRRRLRTERQDARRIPQRARSRPLPHLPRPPAQPRGRAAPRRDRRPHVSLPGRQGGDRSAPSDRFRH